MELVCADHRASRCRGGRRWRGAFVLGLLSLPLLALGPAASAQNPPAATLRLGTVTFVATRDDQNEMVLSAQTANMPAGMEVAKLVDVHVQMQNPGGTHNAFEMTCDRGDLQLKSSDFHAEGNVEGRMADGRRIYTPSLDYDSDTGMVTSNAPVRIREGDHTMRGHGFEYNVRDGHFVLRGGASIVQE